MANSLGYGKGVSKGTITMDGDKLTIEKTRKMGTKTSTIDIGAGTQKFTDPSGIAPQMEQSVAGLLAEAHARCLRGLSTVLQTDLVSLSSAARLAKRRRIIPGCICEILERLDVANAFVGHISEPKVMAIIDRLPNALEKGTHEIDLSGISNNDPAAQCHKASIEAERSAGEDKKVKEYAGGSLCPMCSEALQAQKAAANNAGERAKHSEAREHRGFSEKLDSDEKKRAADVAPSVAPLRVGSAIKFYSVSLKRWIDTRVERVNPSGEAQIACKPGRWIPLAEQQQRVRLQVTALQRRHFIKNVCTG